MSEFLEKAQDNFQQNFQRELEKYVADCIKADRLKQPVAFQIEAFASKIVERLARVTESMWYLVSTNAENLRNMIMRDPKCGMEKLYKTDGLPREHPYVVQLSTDRFYKIEVLTEYFIQQVLGLPEVPKTQHQWCDIYYAVIMRPGLMLVYRWGAGSEPMDFSLLFVDRREAINCISTSNPAERYIDLRLSEAPWLQRFCTEQKPTREAVKQWEQEGWERWLCHHYENAEKYKAYFSSPK